MTTKNSKFSIEMTTGLLYELATWCFSDEQSRWHLAHLIFRQDRIEATDGSRLVVVPFGGGVDARVRVRAAGEVAPFVLHRRHAFAIVNLAHPKGCADGALPSRGSHQRVTLNVDAIAGTVSVQTLQNERLTVGKASHTADVLSMFPSAKAIDAILDEREHGIDPTADIGVQARYLAGLWRLGMALGETDAVAMKVRQIGDAVSPLRCELGHGAARCALMQVRL